MKAISSTNRIKEFVYNYSEPSSNTSQAVVMASDSIPSSSSSSNNLPLDYSSPVCSPRKTKANKECSRAEQSAPATETATMSIAKELGASAGSEDTTKLISTAIKFININNNNNSNSSSSSNKSNSDKQRTNSRNTDAGDSNKSTSKSTGATTMSTTVAKSTSSKFINSRNKLTTTTIVRQQEKGRTEEQQQEQQKDEEQQQQQAEQMFLLPTTRDLNQINLKSSLYADQQLCNGGDNNHNNNRSHNQRNDIQNKLNTNVSSNSNNNNNLNNANNNNKKKKQQPQQLNEMSRVACGVLNNNNNNNNNSANASNEANNSESNNNNGKSQVNAKKQKNSNNHKGSCEERNELEELEQQKQPPRQQSLITVAKAAPIQTTIVNELKATTKVRAEKFATTVTPIRKAVAATTIKTPAIERAKTSRLTLRKSLSTPASFKIGDAGWSTLCTSNNNNGNNNNNNEIKQTDSKVNNSNNRKLIISSNKTKNQPATEDVKKQEEERKEKELVCDHKDDSGGGGVAGGGDGVSTDSSHGNCTKTAMATSMTIANLVAPAAANNTKAKSANASIEEAITFTKAITATTKSTACTSTTTKASATMDVVMRSQYVAHAPPHQHHQHQHQHHQHQHPHQHVQQQQQRHHQQSNMKIVKAKTNDNNQVIDDDVCVVSSTTTAPTPSSSLPRPTVSFDLDLRFGCAHYKRRAMFVTPCCNKFYKCRFCHDENESHHFDRKTLTELICSECNTRQKVQEQCEACGTRFGKYTCLICNLFDDTDKKQYHCNGCGICRIGGAENFFHCEVCDMCLPIRLKIDGHRCVENISRSHCPVCLGDIHTSRIPCHIPDCGHLLHKTCFDQLLNSGHYTCPICQTSLIDMTALWEYLDAQAVSLPVPKKYENQRIHIFCNDCHKTSKTKFNFIGLKCMQCGAYNTTQDVKRRMSLVTDEPSSA